MEFEARHPDLGTQFTFSSFVEDGEVCVGQRHYQIYKRNAEKERLLREGTILDIPYTKAMRSQLHSIQK